jgi:hypothetical protein
MWYLAQNVVSSLPMGVGDPEKEQHEQARVKATANLRRLNRPRDDSDSDDDSTNGGNGKGRPRKENLELDQYESQIALEVVAPEDIPVGFDGTLVSAISANLYAKHANLLEILVGSKILLRN